MLESALCRACIVLLNFISRRGGNGQVPNVMESWREAIDAYWTSGRICTIHLDLASLDFVKL